MGAVLNSLDNMILSARTKGMWKRAISDKVATTTAATITSGYVSAQRFPNPASLPSSFGSGITGAVFTLADIAAGASTGPYLVALEYTLGTLTVSGSSWAVGVSMPTKYIGSGDVQTATMIPMAVVTTVLAGATTPDLTLTYTDQSGNSGATAVLTLPTNPAVNSAFCIAPHLASGDTGIRSVENVEISAGSSGVIKIMGLLPINIVGSQTAVYMPILDPLASPLPMYPGATSDVIALYSFGSIGAQDVHAFLAAVADY